jgi:hypothetical protein
MPRRLLLAAAVAAAAAGSLAACGGGGGGDPRATLERAATTTSTGQSFRVDSTTALQLPGSSQRVALDGRGSFDPKTKRGRLAVDLSDLSTLLRTPTGTALMILDGSAVYMRIPFLSAALPGAKPWLKLDLEKSARTRGVDLTGFLQLGRGGDPTQTLSYLRAAGKVKKAGSDKVRGVETTHYRATIDFDKVPSTVRPAERARVRRAIRRLEQVTGLRELPVEVWVDAQGRVRRLRVHEALNLGTGTAEMTVDSQLYDFGVPVQATPPPASSVTDLTKGA